MSSTLPHVAGRDRLGTSPFEEVVKTTSEHIISTICKRLIRDRLALLGLVIIVVLIFVAIFAPFIAPHDPTQVNLERSLEPPSQAYPMGTDNLGRCVFSRVIYGSRISLATALVVVLIVMFLSIVVGTTSGFLGGWVDNVLMRLVDMILAFPSLILALAIAGILGPSLKNLMIAMAAVWWGGYARIIRSVVLSAKERTYILAARVSGTSSLKIILRHILPEVLSVVLVLATLDMGHIILSISGLSFLGLGAQPPTPEWGIMLSDGRAFMHSAPHLMIFPGLAIMITVLAFNLLGDGLRDAIDPRELKEGTG